MDALVAGGTGLVGRALLDELSDDAAYSRIVAVGRRAPDHLPPRVVGRAAVMEALASEELPTADVAFCCLGTTIKKAGSQDAFRAVDHGLVLAFAQAAKRHGAQSFHVVSALGADPASRVFYNRVKGEMERDLRTVGFRTLVLYRPSLLLGEREERRAGERVGIAVAKALRPLIPAKYRGVEAATVARAMARNAKDPTLVGVHVVESDAIQRAGAATTP